MALIYNMTKAFWNSSTKVCKLGIFIPKLKIIISAPNFAITQIREP